jgi:hypothetical protein
MVRGKQQKQWLFYRGRENIKRSSTHRITVMRQVVVDVLSQKWEGHRIVDEGRKLFGSWMTWHGVDTIDWWYVDRFVRSCGIVKQSYGNAPRIEAGAVGMGN